MEKSFPLRRTFCRHFDSFNCEQGRFAGEYDAKFNIAIDENCINLGAQSLLVGEICFGYIEIGF